MQAMKNLKIAVLGMGYVGLPLAVEFGKQFAVVGFDVDSTRIAGLKSGHDNNRETSAADFAAAKGLQFSDQAVAMAQCTVYIVTVPTPVDEHKRPDFTPLRKASQTIGAMLKSGDVVIYESTVYPGATEEICVPELETASGMVFNKDFFVGYSPERINPGDKQRTLTTIPKVTSGSTVEAADFVDALYRKIITAGTHRAPSIKVAEAAKVIENTQRDVNIALINEFALIFHRLGIDTSDVLEAAGSKWNFLPFRPGLVGGHCIGVDPYYLIQKAQSAGYYPDILLACRRINDAMGQHVAAEVIRLMIEHGQRIQGARVLMLGLAFKENCPDLRNTRVVELIRYLQDFGCHVDIHDPWADADEASKEYDLELLPTLASATDYDAIVIAVAHEQFRVLGIDAIRKFGQKNVVVYDIKGLFDKNRVDGRL